MEKDKKEKIRSICFLLTDFSYFLSSIPIEKKETAISAVSAPNGKVILSFPNEYPIIATITVPEIR